jgi:hypothetical protein
MHGREGAPRRRSAEQLRRNLVHCRAAEVDRRSRYSIPRSASALSRRMTGDDDGSTDNSQPLVKSCCVTGRPVARWQMWQITCASALQQQQQQHQHQQHRHRQQQSYARYVYASIRFQSPAVRNRSAKVVSKADQPIDDTRSWSDARRTDRINSLAISFNKNLALDVGQRCELVSVPVCERAFVRACVCAAAVRTSMA